MIILTRIQESQELTEEAVKQTEALLKALPETTQAAVLEFTETGEPEAVLAEEKLLVKTAKQAAQLNELAIVESADKPKGKELRQVVAGWYENLADTVGQTVDEVDTAAFIKLVSAEAYQTAQLEAATEEDDAWIDVLIQARMTGQEDDGGEIREVSFSDSEVPVPREVILADIVETLELPPETAEQTETLVVNLPETVQERLAEFIVRKEAEPEAVAATEELVVKIAQVADRLHELTVSVSIMQEQLEEPTAEQIQEIQEIKAVLREWYAELLTTLELPADEETITAFIELVCSGAYQPAKATADQEELSPDIFGERKRDLPFDLSAIIGGVARVEHRLQREIARLMVRGTAAA